MLVNGSIFISVIGGTFDLMVMKYIELQSLSGPGCHSQDPVAEGGPVGLSDGGNRRDWFPRGSGAEDGIQARSIGDGVRII